MVGFISTRSWLIALTGIVISVFIGWQYNILLAILVLMAFFTLFIVIAIKDAVSLARHTIELAIDPKKLAENPDKVLERFPFWVGLFVKPYLKRYANGEFDDKIKQTKKDLLG